ncbi:hypothetical protein MGSAQ_000220 [marine sediment metagenome]|uniref:Uncharacterized protein n=1 Tax=marine sediment metagenome TaxID=412755 RepID=A0A1B6NXZ3_9ZZZZ
MSQRRPDARRQAIASRPVGKCGLPGHHGPGTRAAL